MEEITNNVNWLAVGIGAVVAYMVGWLWYSPALFLNKWLVGIRLTPEDAKMPPAGAMIIQALGTFLLSWIVGVTAVNEALMTMFLVAAMLITLSVSAGLYAQKSVVAVTIEAGYYIVMVVIMIAAQALL